MSSSRSNEEAGQSQRSKNVLDALPCEAREVIVNELTRQDPDLLAKLRLARKPTTMQSDAISRYMAKAIVGNMDEDWVPNDYGLAAERAVTLYFEVWPSDG